MESHPPRSVPSNSLDRIALGEQLLREGTRELERLRMVRGSHKRTVRRIRRALAVVALAASLLGVPLAGTAAATLTPRFANPVNPFGLTNVDRDSAPAFADIDGDGDLDALIGVRNGNAIFFENTGTEGSPDFASPSTNPFGLTNVGSGSVPALADIDGDGDLDALIGIGSGYGGGNTIFFENTGTATSPAFAAPSTNPFGLADVGSSSAPAFADIDGDGDLDALIGDNFGNAILFANSGTATSPAFAAPSTNPFGLTSVAGSAPAFADVDDDGDLDAFVGEAFGNTIFFENTGTATSPAFAAPSTNPFGLADVDSRDIDSRSKPALADVDGDGDLDVLIGGFMGNTVFFENTGTASSPAFPPLSINPFGLAGDVTYASSPALADIDGDGDLDAFIGEGYGATIFFQNTGTVGSPAFASPSTNPFGLAGVGYHGAPTFADIDGDGDLDAFIGEYYGGLGVYGSTIFFENTGTATSPAFASPSTNPFGLTHVGAFSTPALADIDGDGDLDALIGEYYGNAIFFENTGTAASPAFASPSTNPFGLADAGSKSKPALADVDDDGDLDALIGNGDGDAIFFENTGTTVSPAFASPSTNPFGLARVGERSAPALGDIDGDGDLDALIGDRYGDTFLFEHFPIRDTASDTVGAGGTVTTDPEAAGATSADVVETSVTTPDGGTIEIREGDATTSAPSGFTFFGQQISIVAPAASASNPLVILFELDDSLVPAGEDETTVAVFRNSVAVPGCVGGTGEADPDPCVSSRVLQGDGDIALTVLTSQASEWNFGTGEGGPAAGCPAAPDPSCVTGFEKATLLINEKKAGKEKLVAKLLKGPALAQSDFGNPLEAGGTAYQVCLYDDGDELVVEQLEVERAGAACGTNPCWKPIREAPPAGKGYVYKDRDAASDGATLLKLIAGEAGKSLILARGQNDASDGETTLPTGVASQLAATTSVTLQLRTSDAGCFSRTLSEIVKQEADLLKAK